jgi:gliding motility-associated-like protein
VADFIFGPQPTNVLTPEISFTNTSIGANEYLWNFAGLGTSDEVNPSFSFPQENGGLYNVCLAVTSEHGCMDTVCHLVEILDEFLLYVPNAFTPNGDGTNDIFLPVIQGEEPDSYVLLVFNRWGEVIFQSNNKNIGWDGTHNGQKAKEDVYVWKIQAKKLLNEEVKEKVGHVTLLR